MCPIQEAVFELKQGIAFPHKVTISFSRSGMYVQITVGNSFMQRITHRPSNMNEKDCKDCTYPDGYEKPVTAPALISDQIEQKVGDSKRNTAPPG